MAAKHRFSGTVVIAAPPERVWELVSDTARYAEYVEGTIEVTRTDGPARLGSTYDEKNKGLGPWKPRTHWRVIEFDAPRRQVHEASGLPMIEDMRYIAELQPVGDSTEITMSLEYSPKGPLGSLLDPLTRKDIERDQKKSADNFAELAERELR
jgi:carbon monoxide dehydrogenase subunit G